MSVFFYEESSEALLRGPSESPSPVPLPISFLCSISGFLCGTLWQIPLWRTKYLWGLVTRAGRLRSLRGLFSGALNMSVGDPPETCDRYIAIDKAIKMVGEPNISIECV